jgi:hypothetical protein
MRTSDALASGAWKTPQQPGDADCQADEGDERGNGHKYPRKIATEYNKFLPGPFVFDRKRSAILTRDRVINQANPARVNSDTDCTPRGQRLAVVIVGGFGVNLAIHLLYLRQ